MEETVLDPLLPSLPIAQLIKLRSINRGMKATADAEINRRHTVTFGLTDKPINLKIKDLITHEIQYKITTPWTGFPDLVGIGTINYGLMLLDPPIYSKRSGTLNASIKLRNFADELFLYIDKMVYARNSLITKYPRIRSALIQNYHLVLATILIFAYSDGVVPAEYDDFNNIFSEDPLFDPELLHNFIEQVRNRTLDVDAIRGPTADMVNGLTCLHDRADKRRHYPRCGLANNIAILTLLDPTEYFVFGIHEARDSFRLIFNSDPRLDADDRALLEDYLEYRILNRGIFDPYHQQQ